MVARLRVYVTRFPDRPTYQLQWSDQLTGRTRTKTTDVPVSLGSRGRKAAERLAAELETQLQDGSGQFPCRVSWDTFRSRYEAEVLPGLSPQTASKVGTLANHVETILNPRLLSDLDEARVSYLVVGLRKRAVAESTIQSYLGHLKAMLNWAVDQRLLRARPKFPKIRRTKKSKASSPMKGRPITGEEFERMLKATAAVVGDEAAPAWGRYLRGLWTSGLRLTESLDLSWDRQGGLVPVLPEHGRPTLLVPAELEKGHTDRILPMPPEFALQLAETPPLERKGPVFLLSGTRMKGRRPKARRVSEIISAIGKKAGVVVHVAPADPTKVKYASAHDFRRAFGERWAARVMPKQLQELMRHESIETTLRYYVGRNAERTADVCWEAFERAQASATSRPPQTPSDPQGTPAEPRVGSS
jgi:integrase